MACAGPDCRFLYHAPPVVAAATSCERYNAWLKSQARHCWQRDKGKPHRPGQAEYKRVIHKRVCQSKGFDFYTGEPVQWSLLNHSKTIAPGRNAHRRRCRYPSVDHYDGPGKLDYRICSGLVNAAKGPMPHAHFVEFCRQVVMHDDARRAAKRLNR